MDKSVIVIKVSQRAGLVDALDTCDHRRGRGTAHHDAERSVFFVKNALRARRDCGDCVCVGGCVCVGVCGCAGVCVPRLWGLCVRRKSEAG